MLTVQHIEKRFGERWVLRDISFDVHRGETICLLGASGSGKSTLLQIIAGLVPADSGTITFDGKDLAAQVPAHQRDFGLVFQDYVLFPHLDVFDNVAFGLAMRHTPSSEMATRVERVLRLVNLQGFEHRQVTDLSGGEQQRVALARALAPDPRLLMFDEPLGALDRTLKEEVLYQLREILQKTDVPAIYVTHDQEEAFTIADRILILHDGELIREGAPEEVWAEPGSAFVAKFLGLGTIVTGKMTENGTIETVLGTFAASCKQRKGLGEVQLLIRPQETTSDVNLLRGVVKDVIFQQDHYKVTLENGVLLNLTQSPKVGEEVQIPVKVECLE